MLQKLAVFALVAALFGGAVYAHGNATHLMGTVTAVGKDTVTIQDKDGKPVVVTVPKTVKYFKSKKPTTADEVKVGTRVVIDAQMDAKTKMYSAEEIQIGVAQAAPAAASKK